MGLRAEARGASALHQCSGTRGCQEEWAEGSSHVLNFTFTLKYEVRLPGAGAGEGKLAGNRAQGDS